jgi:hypothetical protein
VTLPVVCTTLAAWTRRQYGEVRSSRSAELKARFSGKLMSGDLLKSLQQQL